MIGDNIAIIYDPKIDFIGFNIKQGEIISEKIYYKAENSQHRTEINHPLLRQLLLYEPRLRLFSEEKYQLSKGIIKYDFQVDSEGIWKKSKQFLEENVTIYDKNAVKQIESVNWLPANYTTLSFRVICNEITNVVLYYRRAPKQRALLSSELLSMLSRETAGECASLMSHMLDNGAWVRLVALDFSVGGKWLKIYFETDKPETKNAVVEYFARSENREIIKKITQYSDANGLCFRGIAICAQINRTELRYNLYYNQHETDNAEFKN